MPSYHTLMIVCETCPEKIIVPAMIEPDGQVGIVRGRKRRDGTEEMFGDTDGWEFTALGFWQCPSCATKVAPSILTP